MKTITQRYMQGERFFCPECGYRVVSLGKDNFGTCIKGHIYKIDEKGEN
jgi:hypothetical protein